MTKRMIRGMLLQQPWARLVAEGVFPVLIRSLRTNVRGPVAIVARGTDPKVLIDEHPVRSREFPQPAIIGSVEIEDCEEVPLGQLMPRLKRRFGSRFAEFYPKHYLPEGPSAYLWILRKPRLLKRPKPFSPRSGRVWIRI